jgi:arginine decarboxylase
MLPTKLYLCAATGVHPVGDKNARDAASAMIGLESLNLVSVSSVLPAGIAVIDRAEFAALVRPGQVVFAIHGICESSEVGQVVSSTLSVALPADPTVPGYVTEVYEQPGIAGQVARRRAETMLLQLCADRYGDREFEVDRVWEPDRTGYTVGGVEIDVRTVQAERSVPWEGDFTCALAAAVLLP